MTIIVELKNVTKAYANKTVLDNVSLQVNQGEILALIGPNGSGKSTILKIMAFLENISSGEVKFQNETLVPKMLKSFACKALLYFKKQLYLTLQSMIMLLMG